MLNTYISLDKAIENVLYFTTPCPKGKNKGKTPLQSSEFGVTCFANSLKVVKLYAENEYSVPTKAEKAKEVLNKLRGED